MPGSTRVLSSSTLKIRQSTGRQTLTQRTRSVVGGVVATADTLGNHWACQALDTIVVITITGTPTGGTFTLTYEGQTTTALAYNAPAVAVQTALNNLSTVGAGNLAVSGDQGGPYIVTFQGELGTMPTPPITATASLTGGTGPAVVITVPQQGTRDDRTITPSSGRFDDPMPTTCVVAHMPTNARVEGGHQWVWSGTVTPPPDSRTFQLAQKLSRRGKTFSGRVDWPTT